MSREKCREVERGEVKRGRKKKDGERMKKEREGQGICGEKR